MTGNVWRMITAASSAAILGAQAQVIVEPGYAQLNAAVAEAREASIAVNGGDGRNRGVPAGFFGTNDAVIASMSVDPFCVYSAAAPNLCSTDPAVSDRERGTVTRYSFPGFRSGTFGGISTVVPVDLFIRPSGAPPAPTYNFTGARTLIFDAISSDAEGQVQFGFCGRTWPFQAVSSRWQRYELRIADMSPAPNLAACGITFTVVSNSDRAPRPLHILVDNVRLDPVSAGLAAIPVLPRAYQTYGILPVSADQKGRVAIPPDQLLQSQMPISQAAIAAMVLLRRGDETARASARQILTALLYALNNPNKSLLLPAGLLPECLSSGEVPLFADSGEAKRGESRPCGAPVGQSYRLVLDGATGFGNGMVGVAFLHGYWTLKDEALLAGARTIAQALHANLFDSADPSYGGYWRGIQNGLSKDGVKARVPAKFTSDNAVIGRMFHLLAEAESRNGKTEEADLWRGRAAKALQFVDSMITSGGLVYSGTVLKDIKTDTDLGIIAEGDAMGDELQNILESPVHSAMVLLALLADPMSKEGSKVAEIADRLPVLQQKVVARGEEWLGASPGAHSQGPAGISWGLTAEMALALRLSSRQEGDRAFVQSMQLLRGMERIFILKGGIPAATVDGEERLPVYEECYSNWLEGCVSPRLELGALAWALAASTGWNPLAIPPPQ